MKFQIRRAESNEDWDFFFKLGFETAKVLRKFMLDPFLKDNPDAPEEEISKLYRKETEDFFDFKQPDSRVFIAETEEYESCGYLWMGMRNTKDACDIESPQWIYDIVVDPAFRGHELGRELMQKGENFARELNLNLGLFVHEDNIPARTLYEKMDYRIKQVPISKKLESVNTTSSADDSFSIREMQESDAISIQVAELKKFAEKIRFSFEADDTTTKKLYKEHLEKFSNQQEKHQRFVANTKDEAFAGSIWVGSSGFSEEVAMVHELVIDSVHDSQLVGKQLVDSAEKWSKNAEFSAIYLLLHAEGDLDLEFFKERGYKVLGFFMEKRLKL